MNETQTKKNKQLRWGRGGTGKKKRNNKKNALRVSIVHRVMEMMMQHKSWGAGQGRTK